MQFCKNNLKEESAHLLLHDLPTNVLGLICQLVIDNSLQQRFDQSFRSSFRGLMRLRSTCLCLNAIICDLNLRLPCAVTSDWLLSSGNQSLSDFLAFMRTTCWRFRYVRIKAEVFSGKCDIMSLFHENERLFRKSIDTLLLHVPDTNSVLVDNLIIWLKINALRMRCTFEIFLRESSVILSESKLVSRVTFIDIENNQLRAHNVKMLGFCFNLTELVLPYLDISIENLKSFLHLKFLCVGDLDISMLIMEKNCTSIPNIKTLIIQNSKRNNYEFLPRVIRQYFPRLEYFEIFDDEFVDNDEVVDFSGLPSSCKSLKTEFDLFQSFKNCDFIKNLSLKDYALELDNSNVSKNLCSTNSQVSVLQIKFVSNFPTNVIRIIANIIGNLKNLEVLRVSVSSSPYPVSDIESQFTSEYEKTLLKLEEGMYDSDSISFLRQQFLVEETDKRNLKLLILGQTAFMDKSASANLLRRVDNFELEFGWKLRPRNGKILPLELILE